MPYYEVIYETGAHSIAEYTGDEEAMLAINAHHDRARNGQPGGPTGHPAERIARILKYDRHPAEFGESQAINVEDLQKELAVIVAHTTVGDMVSVPEVAAAVRDITNPTVESGPHDSNYKMKETTELAWTGA